MYYDYYYNDDNIIISSVCITIMKTLKPGGKMIFFFLMSRRSHRKCPDDMKNLSWVFVAYKWNSSNVLAWMRRMSKGHGRHRDGTVTRRRHLCHWILLIILLLRRNVLLVFCCKVLNTKKTNQHKNIMIFLKRRRKNKSEAVGPISLIFVFFFRIGNGFRFVIAVIV